jgi:hypothetical protein
MPAPGDIAALRRLCQMETYKLPFAMFGAFHQPLELEQGVKE